MIQSRNPNSCLTPAQKANLSLRLKQERKSKVLQVYVRCLDLQAIHTAFTYKVIRDNTTLRPIYKYKIPSTVLELLKLSHGIRISLATWNQAKVTFEDVLWLCKFLEVHPFQVINPIMEVFISKNLMEKKKLTDKLTNNRLNPGLIRKIRLYSGNRSRIDA